MCGWVGASTLFSQMHTKHAVAVIAGNAIQLSVYLSACLSRDSVLGLLVDMALGGGAADLQVEDRQCHGAASHDMLASTAATLKKRLYPGNLRVLKRSSHFYQMLMDDYTSPESASLLSAKFPVSSGVFLCRLSAVNNHVHVTQYLTVVRNTLRVIIILVLSTVWRP